MKGNIIPNIKAKIQMSENKIGRERERERERDRERQRERNGWLTRRKDKFYTQKKMNRDSKYYKLSSFEQVNQIRSCIICNINGSLCI